MCNELTHVDSRGKVSMVDVGDKETTQRVAVAQGFIQMKEETVQMIQSNQHKKGDVLTTANIAGIQGAKRTSDLIPLCHTLLLSKVKLEFEIESEGVRVEAMAKTSAQTGVEMEALTAVSVACLTIYDMCKAVDKDMVISQICLLEKQGGKSGHYQRKA